MEWWEQNPLKKLASNDVRNYLYVGASELGWVSFFARAAPDPSSGMNTLFPLTLYPPARRNAPASQDTITVSAVLCKEEYTVHPVRGSCHHPLPKTRRKTWEICTKERHPFGTSTPWFGRPSVERTEKRGLIIQETCASLKKSDLCGTTTADRRS